MTSSSSRKKIRSYMREHGVKFNVARRALARLGDSAVPGGGEVTLGDHLGSLLGGHRKPGSHRYLVGTVGKELVYTHDFSAPVASGNIALVGGTGSGRTQTARLIVAGFLSDGGQVAIIAPKPQPWMDFLSDERAHLELSNSEGYMPLAVGDAREGIVDFGSNLEAAAEIVSRARAMVERRRERPGKYRPFLLVGNLLRALLDPFMTGAAKDLSERILEDLRYIMAHQKGTGVHIMLSEPRLNNSPLTDTFMATADTVIGARLPLPALQELVGEEFSVESNQAAGEYTAWIYSRKENKAICYAQEWLGSAIEARDALDTFAPFPESAPVLAHPMKKAREDYSIPADDYLLGETLTGEPVVLTTGQAASPHLLVTGRSGIGKTELLRSIARQALDNGKKVYVLTTHRKEFADLAQYAPDALTIFSDDPVSTIEALKMMNTLTPDDGGHLLIIDGFLSFAYPSQSKEEMAPYYHHQYEHDFEKELEKLIRTGRSRGVTIAASDSWLSKSVPSMKALYENAGAVVGLGPMDAIKQKIAFADSLRWHLSLDDQFYRKGIGRVKVWGMKVVSFMTYPPATVDENTDTAE